jgi:hypothetical protein
MIDTTPMVPASIQWFESVVPTEWRQDCSRRSGRVDWAVCVKNLGIWAEMGRWSRLEPVGAAGRSSQPAFSEQIPGKTVESSNNPKLAT